MDNITSGHWVFAAIFALAYIGYIIWSFRRDGKLHRIHYKQSYLVLLSILLIIFLIFIFKR